MGTSILDTMALTGKLSALASQLAAVQEENDTIRGRYLELESAWQGMIDENRATHAKNLELREQLEASQQAANQIDQEKKALEREVAALQAEAAAMKGQLAT